MNTIKDCKECPFKSSCDLEIGKWHKFQEGDGIINVKCNKRPNDIGLRIESGLELEFIPWFNEDDCKEYKY